jgi:hypothetical protein
VTATGITIVSGYPRSGTSLMMQMLAAGGLPVLVDECKKPDEHNPRGYFDYERALNLGNEGETTDWVADAQGKAVKVIAYHLQHLPTTFEYRVIFMKRKIAEVLASWGKMGLVRADVKLSEREQILAFKTEYTIYEARLVRPVQRLARQSARTDCARARISRRAARCRGNVGSD